MTLLQRWVMIACATIVALLVAVSTHATVGQPGTLDSTFGTGGTVVTPLGSGNSAESWAMAIQPDGKVVVVGNCKGVVNSDFCAVRYNPDGTLDNSFGTGGKVVTPVSSGVDQALAVTLQPDGKIVLVGYCSGDFCAVRYLRNGTLDASFGISGTAITSIGTGNNAAAFAVALQPDGKLVLAGYCLGALNTEFCTLRYNADGTLDASFGVGGRVITPVGARGDNPSAMALQPDGKLVLAGTCDGAISSHFCAVRYNANGTLDSTFGTGGKVITPIGIGEDRGRSLALQPDGKLIVAGDCFNGVNPDACALRYDINGTIDITFGTGGTLVTTIGSGYAAVAAVALQPDGKILFAVDCIEASKTRFCAARYNSNGTLDNTFGAGGIVITPVGNVGLARAIAIQPEGKVVMAGTCDNGVTGAFCAARYDGGPFGFQNCKPDIDGDGSYLATTDALIYMRVALGITGSAVVSGISFPSNATRNTWPLIREYLITQCGMSLQL